MNEPTIFQKTRFRLAFWYAGVMGLILGGTGLGVYEAIDHAHRIAADRELQSVARQIVENLNPILQTNATSQSIIEALPNACEISQCSVATSSLRPSDEMLPDDYYIRLFNSTQALIGLAGSKPSGLEFSDNFQSWNVINDSEGNRYRQITVSLTQPDDALWGYMQVGSSLKASDQYLTSVRWVFGLGFPLALLFVGGASWWLAGRAMDPILLSYRQMQQFTADAAHELRTPLAAAQATVESALGSPQEVTQEALQVLDRQHQRLSQLVQDLLFLTRLDKETSPINNICCLQDMIQDISEELAALSLSHQIQFETTIKATKMLWVTGNEDELYRLILNLVMNAFQHTPAHGIVSLVLTEKEEKAIILVKDTGPGIQPELQAKIFDRFFRVARDRSRRSGGAGLGLSIAQAIALKHRGKIQVESALGQSSTFLISLPLESA